MTRKARGADILAQALVRAGTRYLFSLSGNQIMPVYDAAIDAKLNIVHTRHEGAAVHMADAWGRHTGEPGVAIVTGGPGHANAVSAIYTALAPDSPMVLLSGHAPLGQLGKGAFQEMRQADMAAPVAKASWTAQSAAGLGHDMARAFAIARSGRPGPVHVSLPFDILEAAAGDAATLPEAAAFAGHATPLGEVVADLQAVTFGKNIWLAFNRDGSPTKPRQPYCKKGIHLMEGENVIDRNGRTCKQCRKQNAAQYWKTYRRHR